MKYGEAFQRLGYRLDIPRLDWTAVSDAGVCITLWHQEIDWKSRPIMMDTKLHAGPIEEWNPAGNNKRIKHLKIAIDEFHGWVDAVIVKGVPGQGVDGAEPWDIKIRQGLKWRVSDLEPIGHFVAKALVFP